MTIAEGSFFREVRWLRVKNIDSQDIPPYSVVYTGDNTDGVSLRFYGANQIYAEVRQFPGFDSVVPEGTDEHFLITGPQTIRSGAYGVASMDFPLQVSVDPADIVAMPTAFSTGIDGIPFGPMPESFNASWRTSLPIWAPLGFGYDSQGNGLTSRLWIVSRPPHWGSVIAEHFGPLIYGPSGGQGGSLFSGLVGSARSLTGAPTTGNGWVCGAGGSYIINAFASVGTIDSGVTLTLSVLVNGGSVVQTTRATPSFNSGGYGTITMQGSPRENMAIGFPLTLNQFDIVNVAVIASQLTTLYATDGYVSFIPN